MGKGAGAIALIVLPATFIAAVVGVQQHARPFDLVVDPLASEHVAIAVVKLTDAILLPANEGSDVLVPAWGDERADAVYLTMHPSCLEPIPRCSESHNALAVLEVLPELAVVLVARRCDHASAVHAPQVRILAEAMHLAAKPLTVVRLDWLCTVVFR
eukprot:CAMPEP_0115830516 /NCGR_PEP_ID=MMETSP0287-20121206/1656_1 /TAXON_ID=412157 /ORGANISM="Chrysochromulina rotalis, Strain UIO044" /LENGTH=156 /DNA_ID=CAMNT_0003283819 /DNA_START=470 /DNA_END=936 /DNA_ORIENTATION=+